MSSFEEKRKAFHQSLKVDNKNINNAQSKKNQFSKKNSSTNDEEGNISRQRSLERGRGNER